MLQADFFVAIVIRLQRSSSPLVFGDLLSYFVISSLVLSGHFVAGTPEFLSKVAPGMIIGPFFCFGYALRVRRILDSAKVPGL